MKPALVILAAGASERLGECKALAQIGPCCALEHLLAAGADFDEAPPLVIAGAHFEAIRERVASRCEIVLHRDWAASRTRGVALASTLRPGRDLCIAPVDVPLVPRAVFAALAREWLALGAPARGWLAPHFPAEAALELRRYGHPVLAGRDLFGSLARAEKTSTLRDLRRSATSLASIGVADETVLDDLDTQDDLIRLRARFSRG